jgi:hypothetical protein
MTRFCTNLPLENPVIGAVEMLWSCDIESQLGNGVYGFLAFLSLDADLLSCTMQALYHLVKM